MNEVQPGRSQAEEPAPPAAVPTERLAQAIRAAFSTRPEPGRVWITGKAILEASTDFGRTARGHPQLVVGARSTDDVCDVLRVANELAVQVTPRGNGGSTEGQTVVQSGIVLDMRGLRTIELHRLGRERYIAVLGAGGTWAAAIDAVRRWSGRKGRPSLQFSVVPGYKNLTVGGTLSVGGGGYRSHTRGLQVDHVIEIEVVTGSGELMTATSEHNPELFFAVLGGCGQVGVITKATLPLVPDERAEGKRLASYAISFSDRNRFIEAVLDPASAETFYEMQGNARPARSGWTYILKGSVDRQVIRGRDLRARFPEARVRRKAHALIRSGRHGRWESLGYDLGLRLVGRWRTPHPWATTFLPIDRTGDFFRQQLEAVDPVGLGRLGFVTLLPTHHHHRPYTFLQLPGGGRFGSFGIFYMPTDDGSAPRLWEQLNQMQRAADAVGGKSYLSDTLPPTVGAWRHYFGDQLERVREAKRRYDPNGVLKPVNPSQAQLYT